MLVKSPDANYATQRFSYLASGLLTNTTYYYQVVFYDSVNGIYTYGAIVTFEIKGGQKEDVFRFMDRLKLVVCGTSLGDVHTTVLYPAIASHRDLAPKQRERLGIFDGTVRFCLGIESAEDIIADLDQALASAPTT